jgi:hypothetical protein
MQPNCDKTRKHTGLEDLQVYTCDYANKTWELADVSDIQERLSVYINEKKALKFTGIKARLEKLMGLAYHLLEKYTSENTFVDASELFDQMFELRERDKVAFRHFMDTLLRRLGIPPPASYSNPFVDTARNLLGFPFREFNAAADLVFCPDKDEIVQFNLDRIQGQYNSLKKRKKRDIIDVMVVICDSDIDWRRYACRETSTSAKSNNMLVALSRTWYAMLSHDDFFQRLNVLHKLLEEDGMIRYSSDKDVLGLHDRIQEIFVSARSRKGAKGSSPVMVVQAMDILRRGFLACSLHYMSGSADDLRQAIVTS